MTAPHRKGGNREWKPAPDGNRGTVGTARKRTRRRPRRRKPEPGPRFASTEARHAAERFGLFPAKIPATGRGSKITVGDVIRAAEDHATDRTPQARACAGTRVHNWPTSKIPPWAPKFLDALVVDPNVSRAAAIAGIGRQHAYAVRNASAAFAASWDEAVEIAVDALESEVRRRALDGVPRPVYQGGRLAGFVREHSDQLAALLLKAHRPEKYRENIRHSGIPEPAPAETHVTVNMGHLVSRQLQALAERPSAPGLPANDRFRGQAKSPSFGNQPPVATGGPAKEKT